MNRRLLGSLLGITSGWCAVTASSLSIDGASSAFAQWQPHADYVLWDGTTVGHGGAMYDSPRWAEPGVSAVGIEQIVDAEPGGGLFIGEKVILYKRDVSDPQNLNGLRTVLVESGQLAPTVSNNLFPNDPYVFGGALDSFEEVFEAHRVFRGLSASPDYAVFFAGLVRQSQFHPGEFPYDNWPAAERIGIYRVHLATGAIESIAVQGEPVADDLTPAAFYADSVWHIPQYAQSGIPDNYITPLRVEARFGKSAGLSINSSGLVTFRVAVQIPNMPHGPYFGAIFAETAIGELRFVAIENVLDSNGKISTGVTGVGDVVPTLLGRPVINDDGVIAFYAQTIVESAFESGCVPDACGTGTFVWEYGYTDPFSNGPLTCVLHSRHNIALLPTGIRSIKLAPDSFPTSESLGLEWSSLLSMDQPDLNCHGDLAFRAYVEFESEEPQGGSYVTSTVWRWLRSTRQYDIVFRSGDIAPIDVAGDAVPGVIAPAYGDCEVGFSTFGRPMINGWGEVACIAGLCRGLNPDPCEQLCVGDAAYGNAILLLYNRDDEARTVFITDWEFHSFVDFYGYTRLIGDFGSKTFAYGYYNEVSLNDLGQIGVFSEYYGDSPSNAGDALLFWNPQDPPPGIGVHVRPAVHTGIANLPPTLIDTGGHSLVVGAGSAQDGDSVLSNFGDLLYSVVFWGSPQLFGVLSTRIPRPGFMACRADLNEDGVVNTADLGILVAMFGEFCEEPGCPGDLNSDGVVNTGDLGLFIGSFGDFCDGCLAPPPGAEAQMAQAANALGALSELLREVGFSTAESYCTWLSVCSPEERGRHAEFLLELAAEKK